MSPRTGRPTDDPKGERIGIRLSETDLDKLEYCSQHTGLSRAAIIREGINLIYNNLKTNTSTNTPTDTKKD